MDVTVTITRKDGSKENIQVLCRIDTQDEIGYYENGGIMHYVLRDLRRGGSKVGGCLKTIVVRFNPSPLREGVFLFTGHASVSVLPLPVMGGGVRGGGIQCGILKIYVVSALPPLSPLPLRRRGEIQTGTRGLFTTGVRALISGLYFPQRT